MRTLGFEDSDVFRVGLLKLDSTWTRTTHHQRIRMQYGHKSSEHTTRETTGQTGVRLSRVKQSPFFVGAPRCGGASEMSISAWASQWRQPSLSAMTHMRWAHGQSGHESTDYTLRVVIFCRWIGSLAHRFVLEQGRGQT